MTTLHKLTSLQFKNLPKGKYNDGGGLWLSKGENGKGKWFYRFTIHGARREMGLGSSSEVLLKDARKSVSEWRDVLRSGKDLIMERGRRLREASQPEATLEFVAREAFKAKQADG